MQTIQVEPIYSISKLNTRNTPPDKWQYFRKSIVVERSWWATALSQQQRAVISQRGPPVVPIDGWVEKPPSPQHPEQSTGQQCVPSLPDLDCVITTNSFLRAYNHSFSIYYWAPWLIGDYSIATIYPHPTKSAFRFGELMSVDGANRVVWECAVRFLAEHAETGIIVKLNSSPLNTRPVMTVEQLAQIPIVTDLAQYLVLAPWSYDCADSSLFRVFLSQGRVVAVCQHHCYCYVGLTRPLMFEAAAAILRWVTSLVDFPYKTACLTVSKDPFGAVSLLDVCSAEPWSGTESGLFNWETDADILTGKRGGVVARYLDINSPLLSPKSLTAVNSSLIVSVISI
jgi:hypothetical protein